MSTAASDYGLSKQVSSARVLAPELPYRPPMPRRYRPRIGLVGAGGIAEYHLRAYLKMGLEVGCICDVDLSKAKSRRDQFFPKAEVCSDYLEVTSRPDIEVIDAALHPVERAPLIETAVRSGKHVLSQKPFAVDLAEAERLISAAEASGVKLAVNQNGRWAPHLAYAREAAGAGLLGELSTVDFQLAFDHSWTVGTPFEKIHHLVLYDFGVHWFDMAACLLGSNSVHTVYATVQRAAYQNARPPFLASVILAGERMQVRMSFNAAVQYGQADTTTICGSKGTLHSRGPSLSDQRIVLTTSQGECVPHLEGTWFENGFQGTMGELLCAIEEDREPANSARTTLRTLELCFAAVQSADSGQPVRPGTVRSLPGQTEHRPA